MNVRRLRRVFDLAVAVAVVGCGDDATDWATPPAEPAQTKELTAELIEFGDNWKRASEVRRLAMADLAKVQSLFHGATKSQVQTALNDADESGIDRFSEDVMRYELGDAPAAYGGGKYHLTFVFEDDEVVRVMTNAISDTP
jgi:hypothetical protein